MGKENNNLMDNKVYDYAYIDVITGLKNRNYIYYMLPGVIGDNGNGDYSAILIDINDFKTLNDVCGYEFGNKVLKKQFRDTSLPEYIANILKEYGLPPSVLELEVTESAIIENIKYADRMLNEFIKKGIKIAIDDFGTGYSSYNQLSNLSLNTLKVDKSFIDFINCDNKKNLIIKNVIDLAHILNMKVVAEGVEQEHQMKTLKEYGCDIIQGFYYSKPLSTQDFEEYIMKKEGKC